jgi:hypothetical protein
MRELSREVGNYSCHSRVIVYSRWQDFFPWLFNFWKVDRMEHSMVPGGEITRSKPKLND